jgi:hypothetical protein
VPASATYRDNPDLRQTAEVWVNNEGSGIALYVASPTLGAVSITYGGGYGVIQPGTVVLNVGTDLTPPMGTDGTVTILDPQAKTTYDFWQLVGTGATRTATTSVSHPLDGPGIGDPNGAGPGKPTPAGIRAAWTSAAAGLLRGWHFEPGAVINHALACSLRNEQLKSGWVYPIAVSEDADGATSYAGSIPMGTRLAIPRDVALDSLGITSDIGRKVALAAQTYGIYVVDRHGANSALTLYATPTEVTETQLQPLKIWWESTDLVRIRNALRIVDW